MSAFGAVAEFAVGDYGAIPGAPVEILLPADSLTEADLLPRAGGVVLVIELPPDTISVAAEGVPAVRTGARVAIATESDVTFELGSPADGAVAGDALLSGDGILLHLRDPDHAQFAGKAVSPRSGAALRIPAQTFTETDLRIEPGALRRKLRVKSIDS